MCFFEVALRTFKRWFELAECKDDTKQRNLQCEAHLANPPLALYVMLWGQTDKWYQAKQYLQHRSYSGAASNWSEHCVTVAVDRHGTSSRCIQEVLYCAQKMDKFVRNGEGKPRGRLASPNSHLRGHQMVCLCVYEVTTVEVVWLIWSLSIWITCIIWTTSFHWTYQLWMMCSLNIC